MSGHLPATVEFTKKYMPSEVLLADPETYLSTHSEAQLKAIAAHHIAGDWRRYVDAHANHNYRVAALCHAVEQGLEGVSYWLTVRDLYTRCPNPGVAQDTFLELFLWGPEPGIRACMSTAELVVLDNLPDDINVYRGTRPEHKLGMSWTLELRVAMQFAKQVGGEVYSGRTSKNAVLAYFSDRDESELLLVPDEMWFSALELFPTHKHIRQSDPT